MQNNQNKNGDLIAIEGNYQYQAINSKISVQRFWHEAKLELIDYCWDIKKGEKILDVGAGSGVVSAYMASKGADVIGVDCNISAIDFAQKQWKNINNLSFMHGLVNDLGFSNNSFHKIICMELIEHISPQQILNLLDSLHSFLLPNGELLLTTPNYKSFWPVIEFMMDKFSNAPTLQNEQHITFLNKKKLLNLFTKKHWEITKCQSFLNLSPWIAALNWNFGKYLLNLELKNHCYFGSILFVIAKKSINNCNSI